MSHRQNLLSLVDGMQMCKLHILPITLHAGLFLGVQRYTKKRIAVYCDIEDPYCDTYCNTPGIFISVYYCP